MAETAKEPPQLRMGCTRFAMLGQPVLPPEYRLRAYRPGDEDAWARILSTGQFGDWDRERVVRMMTVDYAPLPVEGIHFLTHRAEPVGTACMFLRSGDRGEHSQFGWLAVLPDHRGRGLGLQLTLAVLGFIRRLNHDYCWLGTEDFRLAAIKTYLRLGFEPEMTDPSHPARWRAVRTSLGL